MTIQLHIMLSQHDRGQGNIFSIRGSHTKKPRVSAGLLYAGFFCSDYSTLRPAQVHTLIGLYPERSCVFVDCRSIMSAYLFMMDKNKISFLVCNIFFAALPKKFFAGGKPKYPCSKISSMIGLRAAAPWAALFS
jgi:hypothetical protein